uniref:Uncharacterized protein n=1 Tax=Rousettus aegyptiacus TaxID=9407 RepID=A0A7J8H112_ROUAE|nr:hypothetical protein HJG63_011204 [Rousettus aegyptiacus]
MLQLDLFCRRQGKWSEIPYRQALWFYTRNPALQSPRTQKPGPRESPPIFWILPFSTTHCLSGGTSDTSQSGGRTPLPSSIPDSPISEPGPIGPLPYTRIYPCLSGNAEVSPVGVTHSETSYHPAPQKILPLWEVADEKGTV